PLRAPPAPDRTPSGGAVGARRLRPVGAVARGGGVVPRPAPGRALAPRPAPGSPRPTGAALVRDRDDRAPVRRRALQPVGGLGGGRAAARLRARPGDAVRDAGRAHVEPVVRRDTPRLDQPAP